MRPGPPASPRAPASKGYTLKKVLASFGDRKGDDPGNIAPRLYTDSGGLPGELQATLSWASPTGAVENQEFTCTPSDHANCKLEPNTSYHLAFETDKPDAAAGNYYQWVEVRGDDTPNASGWSISATSSRKVSGSWSGASGSGSGSFSLRADATPVLAASGVASRTAELTLQNYANAWRYKRTFPGTGTCTKVDAGTGKVKLTRLSGGRKYTFTAYSDSGCSTEIASVTFNTLRANNPPQLIGNIPDVTLYLDDAGTKVDMSQYFRDQDYEFLRFMPQSANPRVVTASSAGGDIIFNVMSLGTARMTVIAVDGAGDTAFGTFTITVLDPNDAPEAVGIIPPQEIRLGEPGLEIDLEPYFTDKNADPLTYAAESADDSIVSASVEGSVVTLTGVALGESSVKVTATDDGGASRSQSGRGGETKSAAQEIFVVVLPANEPPELVSEIPDYSMQDDDEPLGVSIAEYFTDPDEEELSFSAMGSDDTLARVDVHELSTVVIRLLRRVDPGTTETLEVTVTARDEAGASVSDAFEVVVVGNLPPEAVGSIDDVPLLEGSDMLLEVAEYFTDPNGDEADVHGGIGQHGVGERHKHRGQPADSDTGRSARGRGRRNHIRP